jgi:hypothetical protein
MDAEAYDELTTEPLMATKSKNDCIGTLYVVNEALSTNAT